MNIDDRGQTERKNIDDTIGIADYLGSEYRYHVMSV